MTRQLRGMGAGRYDVAVREPGSETGEVRRWTVEEVGAALPWLKRANAQGREVLVRPAVGEDAELVLVGGLNAERVAAMTAAGRELAVVVEASPGRLEGWMRVPGCDEARRQEILRQLATERGADPERATAGRYGRLAGFTNPGAGDERGRPWVLCRASTGRTASAGAELVAAAGQRLEARARAVLEARWHERELERERSRGRGGMEL